MTGRGGYLSDTGVMGIGANEGNKISGLVTPPGKPPNSLLLHNSADISQYEGRNMTF